MVDMADLKKRVDEFNVYYRKDNELITKLVTDLWDKIKELTDPTRRREHNDVC